MTVLNALEFVNTSLNNIKQNGDILNAMTNVTTESGEIAELAVAAAAESNMYAVYVGSINHLKIAHAKKTLILNYVKGAAADADTFIYDVIVKYNNTNSEGLPTVLCSINVSDFVSMATAARAAAATGELSSSADISVDWDKLSSYKDLSDYLEKHNDLHDEVESAIVATKPFCK
jgi:hypothetical protein